MSRYSINGYIAALRARARQTILVEGVDDKKVLAGFFARLEELGQLHVCPHVVDTAEMIHEKGSGLGNRELVEVVHARMGAQDLFGFVDREFREFDLGPPIVDHLRSHKVVSKSLAWTRGHSSENYGFGSSLVMRFLTRMLPEQVDSEMRGEIAARIPEVLHWCAAFSVACALESLIRRAGGLLSLNCWIVDGVGTVALDCSEIEKALVSRGVDVAHAQAVVQRTRAQHSSLLSHPERDSLIQWVAHGHLGTEGLWSGVGQFLKKRFGLADYVAEVVATGHQDIKLRLIAEVWAEHVVAGIVEPPQALLDWVGKKSP